MYVTSWRGLPDNNSIAARRNPIAHYIQGSLTTTTDLQLTDWLSLLANCNLTCFKKRSRKGEKFGNNICVDPPEIFFFL